MQTLDIIIIVAYFVGMLVIGFVAGKKQKGFDDYFLGGKSMGALTIGCLWMAGWIGGSSVSGTASYGYSMGVTGIWYVLSITIGILIFGFTMTVPVKKVSNKINNITIPDLMEARYDSKTRIVTTITVFLATIGFVSSQFVVGASALNVLTGWSLGKCYIVTATTITVYVALGGLLAVTYTDAIQMILLLGGVVICGVPIAISTMKASGQTLATALPASYFKLGERGWENIISLGVSTSISFFTMSDSYTRCISAKSAKTAKRGALVAAGAVLIIAFSCTFLGMAAKAILPEEVTANNALASLIVNIFPSGLKALALVGILSAVMSTADISILIASTSVTKDIVMRYINPRFNEKKAVVLGFVVAIVVGAVACWFGWYSNDVVSIINLTYTVNSAGLFIPIICAFFWNKGCSDGAFASILSAIIIIFGWYILGQTTDLALFKTSALWPALFTSMVLFFGISLIHKKSDEEIKKSEYFIAASKE